MVLKLHVSLETLAGERIAEVKSDQTFQDMFGAHVLGSAEAALLNVLETQVVSPCRALLRMHVNKLREQAGGDRLDHAAHAPALDVAGITAAMLQRLETVAAQTRGA